MKDNKNRADSRGWTLLSYKYRMKWYSEDGYTVIADYMNSLDVGQCEYIESGIVCRASSPYYCEIIDAYKDNMCRYGLSWKLCRLECCWDWPSIAQSVGATIGCWRDLSDL